MAAVLPFPLYRRSAYVRKQAVFYMRQGWEAGERNLARQADLQFKIMVRKGVSEDAARHQVEQLQKAIRMDAHYASRGGVA